MFPKPDKRAKTKPTGLKGTGTKRKSRSKLYRLVVRPAYLAGLAAGQGRRNQQALCERCGINIGSEVHHVAGREGDGLHDPANLANLCTKCHSFCHGQPDAAREEGWIKSRHQKVAQAQG